MLTINQAEVGKLISMESCITTLEAAFIDMARGEAVQDLRSVIPLEQGNLFGQMPGYLKREEVIGTKLITVFPNNHDKGLPSHQGVVVLFDAKDGTVKACIDGGKITAVRTAAASGVATKLLAREDSHTLSIIGTGEQARTHLEAMLLVRPIKYVKVWGRRKDKALLFKEEMEEKYHIPIEVYDTAEEAVREADIICTVSSAQTPVLKGEWVKKGIHINAVGACTPNARELDSELVRKSLLYVDSKQSAIHESGDYLIPLKEGSITEKHIVGELGDLMIKKVEGRTSDQSITIFNSLGLAIEDIAAANLIYQKAVKLQQVN